MLFVIYDFDWEAGFLVFVEEVALGVEAAENLAVGEVVAGAGAVESCEKRCGYENHFFAAGQELWGFVEYGCVDDCFFVSLYKVIYLFCDNRVDD